MVVHINNSNIQEMEAGGLHIEILSQRKQKTKSKALLFLLISG
jgi:hypothetical protein